MSQSLKHYGATSPQRGKKLTIMKRKNLIAALLFCAAPMMAQNADPVIMKIAGKPVLRSEFEYSYNKNNSEGVIDKKNIDEYVDLFINYKLKVQAALDEHLDTLSSYQQEFRQYRDQQIKPAIVTDADVEEEAHRIYDAEVKRIGPDGLLQVAHVFVRLSPDADKQTEAEKKGLKLENKGEVSAHRFNLQRNKERSGLQRDGIEEI